MRFQILAGGIALAGGLILLAAAADRPRQDTDPKVAHTSQDQIGEISQDESDAMEAWPQKKANADSSFVVNSGIQTSQSRRRRRLRSRNQRSRQPGRRP